MSHRQFAVVNAHICADRTHQASRRLAGPARADCPGGEWNSSQGASYCPLLIELVDAASAALTGGWDFSFLAGRFRDSPLPWNYVELAQAAVAEATVVLDLDTGGGETLGEVLGGIPDSTSRAQSSRPNPIRRTCPWPPSGWVRWGSTFERESRFCQWRTASPTWCSTGMGRWMRPVARVLRSGRSSGYCVLTPMSGRAASRPVSIVIFVSSFQIR